MALTTMDLIHVRQERKGLAVSEGNKDHTVVDDC